MQADSTILLGQTEVVYQAKLWYYLPVVLWIYDMILLDFYSWQSQLASCVFLVVAEDEEDEEEELGGLFRVSRPQKSKKFQANALDCSRFNPDTSHNWDLEEVE